MFGGLVGRLHPHPSRLVRSRRLDQVHHVGSRASLGSLRLRRSIRRSIERRGPALEGLVHGQGGGTEVKDRNLRRRAARFQRGHAVLGQTHGARGWHLGPALRKFPSHGGSLRRSSSQLRHGCGHGVHRPGHAVREHHGRLAGRIGAKHGRIVEPSIDGRIGVAADRRHNQDEARYARGAASTRESARRRAGHAVPRRGTR